LLPANPIVACPTSSKARDTGKTQLGQVHPRATPARQSAVACKVWPWRSFSQVAGRDRLLNPNDVDPAPFARYSGIGAGIDRPGALTALAYTTELDVLRTRDLCRDRGSFRGNWLKFNGADRLFQRSK
jgi:hypothetical protein